MHAMALRYDLKFSLLHAQGAAVVFPEFLVYNLETDDEEVMQDITSVGQGARSAGKLEVKWTPLAGPEEEDADKPVEDVFDPADLLGKPWHAKCSIKGAIDLPLMVDVAYCQYDFWDFGNGAPQTFTTDTVECEGTSKPVLNYEFVHSIDKVTQEFIDFLSAPLEIRLFVSPDVVSPKDKIGTANETVVNNIKNGGSSSGRVVGGGGGGDAGLKSELAELRAQKEHMAAEIKGLKGQVKTLKLEKRVLIMGSAAANRNILERGGIKGGDASAAFNLQ